jgi:hypothetical protein
MLDNTSLLLYMCREREDPSVCTPPGHIPFCSGICWSLNQSIDPFNSQPTRGDSLSHPTAWRSCLSLYNSISAEKGYVVQIAVTTNPPHFLTWMNIRWLRLVCRHLTPLFPLTQKGKRFFMSRAQIRFGIHRNFLFYFFCYRADFFQLQTPPPLLPDM